jgi:type II secretory pathway component HofQ
MTDGSRAGQIAVNVPPEAEAGVFADLAAVWHTPNTFVLDFLSVTSPPGEQQIVPDGPVVPVLQAKVASRVRVPAEQVFMIINALQAQADQWLEETGKSQAPEGWLPHT